MQLSLLSSADKVEKNKNCVITCDNCGIVYLTIGTLCGFERMPECFPDKQ